MTIKHYPEGQRKMWSEMTAEEAQAEFGDRMIATDLLTDEVVASGDTSHELEIELTRTETPKRLSELMIRQGSLHRLADFVADLPAQS